MEQSDDFNELWGEMIEWAGRQTETPTDLIRCGMCKKTMSISEFGSDRYKPHGRDVVCKECRKIMVKRYIRKDPIRYQQKSATYGNTRRTRKEALPSGLTQSEWQRCLEYWSYRCAVCERPVGLWHTLAMDHWIPIANPNCPGTILGNVIPLCHGVDGCNNSKSDALPQEWLMRKLGKRKAAKKLAEIEAYFEFILR